MTSQTSWLGWYKPNPLAKIRLFAFSYAGGGAMAFRTWSNSLPTWIELCPVQLPGRENRFTEKAFEQLSPLVETMAKELVAYFSNIPFAFFGHSMGALIAFELARYIRRKHKLSPNYLFASGRLSPEIPELTSHHLLPNKEFKEMLRNYNGTPRAVLENDELMEYLIPLLKADFAICETYEYKEDEPLDCPILAFAGENDHIVDKTKIASWKQHTKKDFYIKMFDGDHFFLREFQKEIIQLIEEKLIHLTK